MLKNLDIYLPLALLVLSAFLRLFIDRRVGKLEFKETLCEVPVDLIFLAMSFVLAFIVANPFPEEQATGLFTIIVFVIMSIITVVLRKRTIELAPSPKVSWYFLLILNFAMSMTALFVSIKILKNDGKVDQAEPGKQKTEQIDKKKENA